MSISGLTAFSSFTEQAPLSPDYLNSKLGEVYTNLTQIAALAVQPSELTTSALSSTLSSPGNWHVQAFGAVGSGDETSQFNAAISFANAAGGGRVYCSAISYSALSIGMKPGVWLDLNGATINKVAGGAIASRIINLSGSTAGMPSSSLSTTVASGVTAIPAAPGSFSTGDIIILQDSSWACVSGSSNLGQNLEINRIVGFSDRTVQLANPTLSSYSLGLGAVMFGLSNATNMRVSNGRLSMASGLNGGCLHIGQTYGTRVDNLICEGMFDDPGIAVQRSAWFAIENCWLRSGRSIGAQGYGNAVEINESAHHGLMVECRQEDVSESAVNARVREFTYANNIAWGGAVNMFNTHGRGANGILIANNRMFGGGIAGGGINVGQSSALAGDRHVQVIGNQLREMAGAAITVAGSANSEVQDVHVIGNKVDRWGVISAADGITVSRASGVVIANNDLRCNSAAGSMNGIIVSGCTGVMVRNNSIRTIPNGFGITISNGQGNCGTITVRDNGIWAISSNAIRTVGSANTNVFVFGNQTDSQSRSFSSTGDVVFGNLWGQSYDPSRGTDGSAVAPSYAFQSEMSLGWYRSGVSTMAPSYGSVNLATNGVRLSVRTLASLSSLNLAVDEVAFTFNASGASLGLRSNGTIWLFTSSASTKG